MWAADSPTLQGVFPYRGIGSITFPVPLLENIEAENVHYVPPATSAPSGCAGGSVGDPKAETGNLCVYAGFELLENAELDAILNATEGRGAQQSGASVVFQAKEISKETKVKAQGTWAVAGPGVPTVVTGTASSITADTATLNADVSPNGEAVEPCVFEYGTTTSYGKSVECSPPSIPGTALGAVSVPGFLEGLSAGTTYHFRISATNAIGESLGADETFETP